MLDPAQRRNKLASRFPQWSPMAIFQQLDVMVESYGERPLLITDSRTYTYRDMQVWSRQLAAGLLASGVKRGDHVALIMANYPEFVAIKYAIARVGAVAVSLNFLLREHELRYVLAQSDSTMLITMNKFGDRDYLQDLDAIMPGWESQGGGEAFPKLREVFVFSTDGDLRSGVKDFPVLESKGSQVRDDQLLTRESEADPHFRSDILYTSGTTGSPKGVMLSHDMVLRTAYASVNVRALDDGDRILFALPMYHVFGYVECLIACTFVGGAVIPHTAFDPENTINAAVRHQANELVCVPLMTLKILDLVRAGGFECPSLRAVFSSGGVCPPTIWQDIRKLLGAKEVYTAYGMTETTASTTCTLPEGSDERLLTTNGKFKDAGIAGEPKLGGYLAIYKTIDPETGQDLPYGERGELLVRGPIVTKGYYNKPDETKKAFTEDGWLHTGDIGTVDKDGYLALTGRLKESYRCGGEMVMPKEIEDLVGVHKQVQQALVVGIPDNKMGEVGCLCIVPEDSEPASQELIELCANKLAKFKVPKYVLFIKESEIPLTATGRPQKFKLAELAVNRLKGEGAI